MQYARDIFPRPLQMCLSSNRRRILCGTIQDVDMPLVCPHIRATPGFSTTWACPLWLGLRSGKRNRLCFSARRNCFACVVVFPFGTLLKYAYRDEYRVAKATVRDGPAMHPLVYRLAATPEMHRRLGGGHVFRPEMIQFKVSCNLMTEGSSRGRLPGLLALCDCVVL